MILRRMAYCLLGCDSEYLIQTNVLEAYIASVFRQTILKLEAGRSCKNVHNFLIDSMVSCQKTFISMMDLFNVHFSHYF